MADFGLYSGLMRKSNIFETKARNRQMEMQIMSAMEQRSAQELKERGAIDAEMQKMFNAVNELDVLERDQTRIQAADKKYRADVINSLKQYNGNVKAFMLSGGAGVLNNYYNNLMQSEEVKGAIENKTNYVQFQHAQANGLYVKPVGVDVEVVQPDGTVKKERQVVSMDKALELYEKDKISKLPWDGAEKNIKISADYFQRLYKDPSNIYSKDNKVTAQDIYLKTLEEGGSVEQAQEKAKNYDLMLQNGATPWTYKTGDPLDYQLKREKLRSLRMSNRAASGGGFGKGTTRDMTRRFKTMKTGGSEKLFAEESKAIGNALGIIYDENTRSFVPSSTLTAFGPEQPVTKSKASYDLSVFDRAIPMEIVKHKDGKYLKVQAEYNLANADDKEGLPMYSMPYLGFFGGGAKATDNAYAENWSVDKDDNVKGHLYIPVDNLLNDTEFRSYMNKKVNVDMDTELYMPTMTHQEQVYEAAQEIEQASNVVQNLIGLSEEEQMFYLNQLYQYEQENQYGYKGSDFVHGYTTERNRRK